MKRGQKPQPTYLKLLRGNPGMHNDRLNFNEPQPDEIVDIPDPPPFLTSFGADEWCVVAEQLQRLHLLTKVDLPSLAAYCHAYQTWRTAAEALAKMAANDPIMSGLVIRGRNNEVAKNPLVAVARNAAGDMVRYAGEFGLTPSARTRIDAGPSGNGPGKFDKFLA
jgi:P27 family predicted phage terminase small subunit